MQQVSRTYTTTSGKPGESYEKLSEVDIAQLIKEPSNVISPYWNYASLNQGITAQFKIVGFNEELDTTNSLLPTEAGIALYQQLYELQRASRTSQALPKETYATTFTGLHLSASGMLVDANSGFGPPSNTVSVKEMEQVKQPSNIGPGGLNLISIPAWIYKNETSQSNFTIG